MLLDGAGGDDERLRDARVGAPLGDQAEHLELARRELGQRTVAGPARVDQRRDDLRVQRRPAVADAPHGLHEGPHLADALLEQVADAAAAVGEQLGGVDRLHVLGQDAAR